MHRTGRAITLGLCTLIAACGAGVPSISSRNAPFETLPPVAAPAPAAVPAVAAIPAVTARAVPFTVTQVNVTVPRSLSTSEANSYYPRADIVWRGDPIGDRHRQVADILEAGLRAGTADMAGSVPVTLDVTAVRFHSLTEKARYSVGGVHNIIFDLTVRNAATGVPLSPTRRVEADLPALGGTAAIEADRQGQTQKVRLHGFLQQVIRQELARYVSG